MIDIEKFLADFEQVPEAKNLYGVRAILEQLQAENKKLRKENPRYCPRCKKFVPYSEVSIDNFHTCDTRTVPKWSEERRLKEELKAELKKLRWIPVSEELPENDDQVWICFADTGYTYNAYYQPTHKTWNLFDYSGGYKKAEANPTHWKPIILPKS